MAKLHAGMVDDGTCFQAIEQTQGKGQRGKRWHSNPGENITISTAFSIKRAGGANISTFPFLLSAAAALGCYDFIKDYAPGSIFIKWPNDIYLNDRKAAGILIENVLKGGMIEWSVVGTGVNVNERNFIERGLNAISLSEATSARHDVVKLGKHLHKCILGRFSMLSHVSASDLMDEYNSKLYKKGEEVILKKGNVNFKARIEKVSANGELVTTGAMERTFKVGEIEFQ